MGSDGAVVFFDQIPLVHDEDAGGSPFHGETGDLDVLLADPLLGIDQDERDVGPIDRLDGLDDGVFLQSKADAALPADSRGIDQKKFLPVAGEGGVDGVPRRPGDGVRDRPFVAEDPIDEGGLADIGSR